MFSFVLCMLTTMAVISIVLQVYNEIMIWDFFLQQFHNATTEKCSMMHYGNMWCPSVYKCYMWMPFNATPM